MNRQLPSPQCLVAIWMSGGTFHGALARRGDVGLGPVPEVVNASNARLEADGCPFSFARPWSPGGVKAATDRFNTGLSTGHERMPTWIRPPKGARKLSVFGRSCGEERPPGWPVGGARIPEGNHVSAQSEHDGERMQRATNSGRERRMRVKGTECGVTAPNACGQCQMPAANGECRSEEAGLHPGRGHQ